MGIEPTSEAWEASILPLYDARSGGDEGRIAPQLRVRKETGGKKQRAGWVLVAKAPPSQNSSSTTKLIVVRNGTATSPVQSSRLQRSM